LPETGKAGERARRKSHQPVAARTLARAKKGARRRGAVLVFWDEAGFSQRPSVRRTWAPKGQTPVLRQPFNWQRLSAIGIIAYTPSTERARLLFSLRPGTVDSDWVVSRLRSLRRQICRPVVLLWDGLPAHRSRITRGFLAGQRRWLRVETLPPYAPELNPVELVWANLSARELGNLCPESLTELAHQVNRGVRRIRRHPSLALAFLSHSKLFPERFL